MGGEFVPRVACARCARPEGFCWCPLLPSIETRTRVVILQHPRERDVGIGTARMASLCLPNSELHVGVDWSGSVALSKALSDATRPAALLYPGEGAVDVVAQPPKGPVTLVVVDGTWTLTRKLVRMNPRLAALPRYAFRPEAPSEYRIRREPQENFVSTIEALALVLGALEGDAERFRAMLVPFRAMVDAQIECQARLQEGRVRHARGRTGTTPRDVSPVRGRGMDMVCVVGEANAWASRVDEGRAPWPAELIQWVACRVSTGELFDVVLAPRNPVAPGTPTQTGLSPALLGAGEGVEALRARWAGFVRETDVVCMWGDYGAALFEALGLWLPRERVDLRKVARAHAKGSVGGAGDFLARVGAGSAGEGGVTGRGRAGMRLRDVVAVARYFSE